MTGNNPKLDVVNADAHTKFTVVRFCLFVLEILSGNKMQKCSRNDGATEGQGESSIAPLFQSKATITAIRFEISYQTLF